MVLCSFESPVSGSSTVPSVLEFDMTPVKRFLHNYPHTSTKNVIRTWQSPDLICCNRTTETVGFMGPPPSVSASPVVRLLWPPRHRATASLNDGRVPSPLWRAEASPWLSMGPSSPWVFPWLPLKCLCPAPLFSQAPQSSWTRATHSPRPRSWG